MLLTKDFIKYQMDALNDNTMIYIAKDMISSALDLQPNTYSFALNKDIIDKYKDRINKGSGNYFYLFLNPEESMNDFSDLVQYILELLNTKFHDVTIRDITEYSYKVIRFKLQDSNYWPVIDLHLNTCSNGKCQIVREVIGQYDNTKYVLKCEGEPI